MSESSLGFAFPNDLHIMWSLMIVMYPYITGLVAGAFIVSSLYHVFNRTELRPVSRLSMVASLAFLLMAPLPLLLHLGHPERCFNIMITPHFTSAMAAFGMIYACYMTLVIVEIWLVYRKEIILVAARSRGIKRLIFKVIALGVYDTSDDALRVDHKVVTTLAALGIPAACILHGYVGFMFGSVKANYWWSTPLMPIIFLFSAVTSGIAMVIVLYLAISRFNQRPIDGDCVQALSRWLWLFTILTVAIEQLEIVTLAYKQGEEWPILSTLLSDKLAFSFLVVQTVIGSLIPIILFAIVVLMSKYLTDPLRNTIAFVASLILLLQVFSMRWNVVIGGQIFSKSLRGFREPYVPELFGREGVVAAIIIFIIPFVVITVFNRFLPLHVDSSHADHGPAADAS